MNPMKLIIQIPCFNEEENLEQTLNDLPKSIVGIDDIEIQIIDDGSKDKTSEIANKWGVDHIVVHDRNLGLAKAFSSGIENALIAGADIIVNTDADNQYCGSCISDLIVPLLRKECDMVIGTRPISNISEFSLTKKILQKLGSTIVRGFSGVDIVDAPSGFRAFSKKAAMKLHIFDPYTYTLDTILQARAKGILIKSVPISVNPSTRESRLVKSNFSYVCKSVRTIVRSYVIYQPLRFFCFLSLAPFLLSMILWTRYFFLFFHGTTKSHAPSLILASMLFFAFLMFVVLGIIADLVSKNRLLIEDTNVRMKERNYS